MSYNTQKGDTDDPIYNVSNPSGNDSVILVMGAIGVGKSTFINKAVGKEVIDIGHELDSETKSITPVIIPYPGNPSRRIIFVDTPGFNDPDVDDAEILRRIATWLKYLCDARVKLAGIIYLHEITQARFATIREEFEMFKQLCQRSSTHNSILVTTKWQQPLNEVEEKREAKLSSQYWKEANMLRFMDTHQSAWDIINRVLKKDPLDTRQFQKVLTNFQKCPPKSTPKSAWGKFAFLFGLHR